MISSFRFLQGRSGWFITICRRSPYSLNSQSKTVSWSVLIFSYFYRSEALIFHWNGNFFILMEFSLLAALEVVKVSSQCRKFRHNDIFVSMLKTISWCVSFYFNILLWFLRWFSLIKPLFSYPLSLGWRHMSVKASHFTCRFLKLMQASNIVTIETQHFLLCSGNSQEIPPQKPPTIRKEFPCRDVISVLSLSKDNLKMCFLFFADSTGTFSCWYYSSPTSSSYPWQFPSSTTISVRSGSCSTVCRTRSFS